MCYTLTMSLDLELVVSQISGMVERLKSAEGENREKLDRAVQLLQDYKGRPEELGDKRLRSNTAWPAPELTAEGLSTGIPLQTAPGNYNALAADGSHIDVDRHHSAHCCLINIGKVSLTYGSAPDAVLSNSPSLYYQESETVIPSPEPGEEGVRLEGAILGARRAIEECRALADMVRSSDHARPTLALLDGSLILWELQQQKYRDFVLKALVRDGLLRHLDDVRSSSEGRLLAFGSYISSPRSAEVVNLLRVACCPFDLPDCAHDCKGKRKAERECEAVAGLRDGDIFAHLLGPGQRSAVFVSRSRVLDKHYGRHQVGFFYLNVCDEIARVELPMWLVERPGTADLAQTLVFEQCRLGDGYPVALAEAHEKAVVTAADREQFWRLVDMVMERRGIVLSGSAKSRSKRRPFV